MMTPHITPRAAFGLLKTTYQEWSEDKASRLAAAMAYYTAFSIAPLILITIAIVGFVFGDDAAQGQVFAQLNGLLGEQGAAAIEESVRASGENKSGGLLATIIGLATLVWSASNLFGQLQEALNTIWEVHPDPNAGMLATVKRRFLSMTMVLGIAFMLLVSLVLSSVLSVVGNFFNGILPGGAFIWEAVNFVISFAVVTLLFAAIYKVLPDATIKWADVWIGAAFTAFLFTLGKFLLGLYLGFASVGSTFGAAGSLLVFLVWVYYTAQILFFGAEFTQVYARTYGSHIEPSDDAIAMDEVVRAEQGIPHASAVDKAAAENPDSPHGPGNGRGTQDQGGKNQQGGKDRNKNRQGRADNQPRKDKSAVAASSQGSGPTNGGGRQHDGREYDLAPVRAHSKFNKKANRIGDDGRKQPNRPERLAEGSKTSLKSLIPVGLAAVGALWVSRNDSKQAQKDKRR